MISKSINIISIIFLFLLFNITFCGESESRLKGEYLNQYQEHKTYIFQIKLTSCINLITQSLKGPEGNKYLHKASKETKLNRDKFYEKYIIALITQCINNVNDGQIDYLLIPENVDKYDLTNDTLTNLIKLDYEITTLEFTPEEKEVKKVIDEIMEENDKGKKKKSIFGFLEPNTLIKILCGSIPFIIFFIYNSRRMIQNPEKKELDDGTKELLEAIKERGKKSPNYKEPDEKKEEKDKDKDKKEIKENKDNKEKTE